jgi:putative type I restriction enzyme specificity protein
MSKVDELLKNEKVEWKKLGEVSEVGTGKSNTNEQIEDGEYLFYVRSKNIKRSNKYEFDETAIVIPGEGGIGEVFHYVEGKYALHQRAYRIHIINEKVITKFVYHYMLQNFKKYIMKNAVSATVSSIRKPMIENFEIPIPSIETQEKIVKILDKFTGYATELQAELQARNKQYSYYRDMLLSEEYLNKISEKLNDFTKNEYGLESIAIGEIVKIRNGRDWKTLGEGEIPVYGSGGKMNIYVDKYTYNKPTVLIPRKGSIENVFYVDELFWNVDTIFYTEIDDKKIIPKYFYYFIENYDIAKLSTDSTRPSLTQSVLNKVKIDLPPIFIQNKVVEILDKFQSLLADTKGLLPQEVKQRQKQYEYYREKLLTFNEEHAKHTHTHTSNHLIDKEYFELLKEASDIAGVKLCEVEHKKLGDIGIFENGTGMPRSMFNELGEVGAIHYGHIYTKYNMFVKDPIVKVSKVNSNKLKKVRNGDLVIAKTSENLDDVMKSIAYLGEKTVVVGGHSAIFRHKENPKYLSYVFNGANYLINQKNKLARGVKVIELSITDMEKIKIPIPSLQVQEYIVSILDKFDILVNDISKGLPKEIELRQKQYEHHREKLLGFKRSN